MDMPLAGIFGSRRSFPMAIQGTQTRSSHAPARMSVHGAAKLCQRVNSHQAGVRVKQINVTSMACGEALVVTATVTDIFAIGKELNAEAFSCGDYIIRTRVIHDDAFERH